MSSNLPPGVTESMIPGNRPEDLAEEEFCEEIASRLAKEGAGDDVIDRVLSEDEWAIKSMLIARDLGYTVGFNDGRMEAQLEEASRHLDPVD